MHVVLPLHYFVCGVLESTAERALSSPRRPWAWSRCLARRPDASCYRRAGDADTQRHGVAVVETDAQRPMEASFFETIKRASQWDRCRNPSDFGFTALHWERGN
ncbi:hypothetical protein ISCGN_004313 [Ixodes scapularis]